MDQIVLASNNRHKLKEIQSVLNPIKVISLSELNFNKDIAETASTFEGNALLKCEAIFKEFGQPVIADDSGLCVPALNNEPGVYSARYAGPKATDYDNCKKLLNELSQHINREAYFVSVICYYINPYTIHYFRGELTGSIGFEITGNQGFGYDPVFIPDNGSKTLAEFTQQEKNRISHRAKALAQFTDFLP